MVYIGIANIQVYCFHFMKYVPVQRALPYWLHLVLEQSFLK